MVAEVKSEADCHNAHEHWVDAQYRVRRRIDRISRTLTPRAALLALIEGSTVKITVKAETHHHRAEFNDALASDRLSTDDCPEGGRLRCTSCQVAQAFTRSLDNLYKHRRALSVVRCPLIERSRSQMR
jgi:hypothetical protein